MAHSPSAKAKAKRSRTAAIDMTTSSPEERKRAYHGTSGSHLFQKGNPGHARNAKNKAPRSFKKLCEHLLSGGQTGLTRKDIRRALMNGVRNGGARHADRYIRIIAEYTDGKPVETQQQRDEELHREIAAASESLSTKLEEVRHALAASAQQGEKRK